MMSDDEVLSNLARNLTALLDERGISRGQLARMTSEDTMTISRTARGTNMPGAAVLARIAEALEVSVDWLISKHGKKESRKTS